MSHSGPIVPADPQPTADVDPQAGHRSAQGGAKDAPGAGAAGSQDECPPAGPFPDYVTIGDKYGPAMKVTEQAEADAYFERCVEHTMRMRPCDRAEAERIERVNLGYFAGYYDHETRGRVERLFRCEHPIFGSIAQNGPPSPEQAFEAGYVRARKGE